MKIFPKIVFLELLGFAAYIALWYFGKVEGNFALLLFVAVCATGLFWLGEQFYFKQQREAEQGKGAHQPWWLDWTAGLFPVILVVFLLRSFLFEPFKIPSGSMIPTLQIGDLILVNKFHYGVRLPVLNKKVTDGTPVARGDVMVFRYPPKPSLDYIKRVVGLPGDVIEYKNKMLSINGQPISKTAMPDYFDEDQMTYAKMFEEKIGDKTHHLLNNERRPAGWNEADTEGDYPFKKNCQYSELGVTCTVPAGHYFMMGDNRDNSLDSRYFGFVPDQNIVGKAVAIWMNTGVLPMTFDFSKFKRIGSFE
ncbi:MAG: signal peptidase I [Cytophagales bacterium]|nr:signal peptidase I [Cytophagales bacterium]